LRRKEGRRRRRAAVGVSGVGAGRRCTAAVATACRRERDRGGVVLREVGERERERVRRGSSRAVPFPLQYTGIPTCDKNYDEDGVVTSGANYAIIIKNHMN